jgi:hypothetical protein
MIPSSGSFFTTRRNFLITHIIRIGSDQVPAATFATSVQSPAWVPGPWGFSRNRTN